MNLTNEVVKDKMIIVPFVLKHNRVITVTATLITSEISVYLYREDLTYEYIGTISPESNKIQYILSDNFERIKLYSTEETTITAEILIEGENSLARTKTDINDKIQNISKDINGDMSKLDNISVNTTYEVAVPDKLVKGQLLILDMTSNDGNCTIYLIKNDGSSKNIGTLSSANRRISYYIDDNFDRIRLYSKEGVIFSGEIKFGGVNDVLSDVSDVLSDVKIKSIGYDYSSILGSRELIVKSDLLKTGNTIDINLISVDSSEIRVGAYLYYSDTEYDTLNPLTNTGHLIKKLTRDYLYVKLYNAIDTGQIRINFSVNSLKADISDLYKKLDTCLGYSYILDGIEVRTYEIVRPEILVKGKSLNCTMTSKEGTVSVYLMHDDSNYIYIGTLSQQKSVSCIIDNNYTKIRLYSPSPITFNGVIEIGNVNNMTLSLLDKTTSPQLLSCNIFHRSGCIGDSYMAGHIQPIGQEHADTKNYDYSWPHYMEKITGNVYTNFSRSGATAKEFVETSLFDAVAAEGNKCQSYHIALLINDQGDWSEYATPCGTISDIGTDADTYYAYYYKLVQKVISINPDAKIFCYTCFNYAYDYSYNVAVRDIVNYCKNNNQNVYLIDTANYRNVDYFYNSIFRADFRNGHFTAIGYNYMAQCHYKLVSSVINNNIDDFENVYKIPYDIVE